MRATLTRVPVKPDTPGEDRITLADGSDIDLWSARDALVLKALTIALSGVLPVSRVCTHIKGHGGAKAAVRQVHHHLADNSFVMRTDVKSYYASIDQLLLMDRLSNHIADRRVLSLLGQYMNRTAERGPPFGHICVARFIQVRTTSGR